MIGRSSREPAVRKRLDRVHKVRVTVEFNAEAAFVDVPDLDGLVSRTGGQFGLRQEEKLIDSVRMRFECFNRRRLNSNALKQK